MKKIYVTLFAIVAAGFVIPSVTRAVSMSAAADDFARTHTPVQRAAVIPATSAKAPAHVVLAKASSTKAAKHSKRKKGAKSSKSAHKGKHSKSSKRKSAGKHKKSSKKA